MDRDEENQIILKRIMRFFTITKKCRKMFNFKYHNENNENFTSVLVKKQAQKETFQPQLPPFLNIWNELPKFYTQKVCHNLKKVVKHCPRHIIRDIDDYT